MESAFTANSKSGIFLSLCCNL